MQKWNRKHQGLKIDPMNKNQIITALNQLYEYKNIKVRKEKKTKRKS